jgi:queuine tRNA-ribosyltransferase
MEFDGYAIGGVSVGEPEPEMLKAIEITGPFLPAHKARYAMGLGTPAQMVELIARGVDMFDCVLPTRIARTGTAVTHTGAFALKGSGYKMDFGPIEEGCECFACRHFTRAYLRHLYLKVMAEVRAAIAAGTFPEFYRNFIAHYTPSQKVLAQRRRETER